MRSPRWRIRLWRAVLFLALVAGAGSPLAAQVPPSPVVAASRALIRFASGQFSLLERRDIRKVLPPSDALPAVQSVSGFWYELRAADGSLRYRRIIEDPVRLVFEGPEEPSPTPGPATPSRKEGIPAERVFSLLIPAPAQGDQLVLFSSPLVPGEQGSPAKEVARLDLFPIVIP